MNAAPQPSPTLETPAPRSRLGLVAAAVATLVSLAILIALGTWQVQRMEWKEGLTQQIEARAYGEPGEILPEAEWGNFSKDEQEYRRVRVSGSFDHAREVQVNGLLATQTRGHPIQGFYVMTPLVLDTGAQVLVNRGFVPTPFREPETRTDALPDGEIEIVGLVRASQEQASFVPDNIPAREQWLTRDVTQIAAVRGLDRAAPFYIDAEFDAQAPEWPRGGGTILDLPNNHLQYAVTWYGLALVLVAVFLLYAFRALRRRE
ncbi:MAG TPA: SURF1 family protein [Saliniramus sp.]|nr:SURF1 family protein [Saliniramus sp.]